MNGDMEIGIGLPSTVPGLTGSGLTTWAATAEREGFASLAVIDRLVYDGYDPLVALAAAAVSTERIRLVSSIVLAPLRTTAVLAKQLASIDHLSGGRLAVGVGLGAREDDYTATRKPFAGRGRVLGEQLSEMRAIWGGALPEGCDRPIGPTPAQLGGPKLYVGAFTEKAIARAVSLADGWISGGFPPDVFAQVASGIRAAWQAAGRDGSPRLLANVYFSLGPDGRETADAYIHDYYAFLGEQAGYVAAAVATTPEAVRGTIDAYRAAGCDELLFLPCSPDPRQVTMLADAALR